MAAPFFATIPHSGEQLPAAADWLIGKDELLLLRDVDRFVDQLYVPTLSTLQIPFILTEWSRYALDLNRFLEDIDQSSVVGAALAAGTHPRGLHWVSTTYNEVLLTQPMSQAIHKKLVQLCFEPFHARVVDLFCQFFDQGASRVFHLDLHSMPSIGTAQHKDPGEDRADIVVSDFHGKSADQDFRDLVMESYRAAGFNVRLNWPYFGGGVTQMYGHPNKGQHTLQVELNRKLYMNEESKLKNEYFASTQKKLEKALESIARGVAQFGT